MKTVLSHLLFAILGLIISEHLDLQRNNLTGSIDFLCKLSIRFIYADCGGDEPEIECSCCLICCKDEKDVDGCGQYLPFVGLFKEYCATEGLGGSICRGG